MKEALKLALINAEAIVRSNLVDDCRHCETTKGSKQTMIWVTGTAQRIIDLIKEALALQALHDENERLGLYKEAYAQPEQDSTCSITLRLQGKPYPRTCKKCGMGPCIAQPTAKQEQEPVGDDWTPCMKLPVVVYVRKQRLGETHVSTREGITPVKPDDLIMRGVSGEEYPIGRAIFEQTYSLNTAPPQRTWVGLTEEDLKLLSAEWRIVYGAWMDDFARDIEAKLKEKNT